MTIDGDLVNSYASILTVEQPCTEAVRWVEERIIRFGLKIIRTFDLQVARNDQVGCPCPHHDTEMCDCQMVVLLIYAEKGEPVALIAHGYNGQTWFSVVDTPQQRADPRLEAVIRQLISQPVLPA